MVIMPGQIYYSPSDNAKIRILEKSVDFGKWRSMYLDAIRGCIGYVSDNLTEEVLGSYWKLHIPDEPFVDEYGFPGHGKIIHKKILYRTDGSISEINNEDNKNIKNGEDIKNVFIENFDSDVFRRAMMLSNHPIISDNGELRYKKNPLVRFLLDNGKVSLNDLWNNLYNLDNATIDDMMQLYRDIGYSLEGFEEIFWDKGMREKFQS